MNELTEIIDSAEKARYDLDIAVSVSQEAAGYLDKSLAERDNRLYLAIRQDDVLNLFSAAFTFLNDAKKDLNGTPDLLYELAKVLNHAKARTRNGKSARRGAIDRSSASLVLVSQICPTNNPKNPTNARNDHQLTIPMAKEICMLQR
jgi:hypothetical protein